MDEDISRTQEVLAIAEADLRARIATQKPDSPDLDLLIAALAKLEADRVRDGQEEYRCPKCGFYTGPRVDYPKCPKCGGESEYYWVVDIKTIDPYFKDREAQFQYLKGIMRLINSKEDELRERILMMSPEIRHDTNVMSDVIRECVKLERAKLGLDRNAGKIVLSVNKDKIAGSKQPDLIGTGRVAGRQYKFAAWVKGNSIEIVYDKTIR